MNYEQGGEQEQPRYRGENEEQEALVQEQRFIDEDVQKNRARTEKENEYFSSVIENLRDLTEKCDVPDSWPLSAVLNYLGGDNPLDEFIDDAPPSSKFYRRPEMMLI